jgi:gliding motility-associated-like protein
MKLIVIPFQQVHLGNDTVLCDGQSILLDANVQGYPLLWNTGDTSEKLLVNKSGLYVLQAGTFCQTFDSILIQYIPNTLSLAADTFFCLGDSIRLAAGSFASYLWNTGSTDSFIYAKTPGIYLVETNTAHCFYTDSILASSETQFETGLPSDTFMCNNSFVLLQAKVGANAYLWNTGDTITRLSATQAGLYWLRTGKSCYVFDSINVVNEMVQLTLPNDTSVCEGSDLWIKPINKTGAQNQFWHTNETSDSIKIANSGWYVLKIDGINCSASDSINITLKANPVFDLGNDTFICQGETIALEVSAQADSYQWNNGNNTAKILVSNPGNYLAVASKDACVYSDSVQVNLKNIPLLSIRDTNLCDNDSILISVDTSMFRYLWTTGDKSWQIWVKQAGNYAVTYSDTFCSNTLTIQVDECPQQELYIPNAFSPNSDGLNDKFTISLPPNCLGKLTIYNRWGEELYFVEGNTLEWDGTFNGNLCQADVYFYVLNITICKTKSYNGKIGLLR